MAVTIAKKPGERFAEKFTVLALGTALLALPGAALAQRDEHHGNDNRAPQQQQSARPAPAPAARPAPAAAPQMERGVNWRGAGQWNGQPRPAPGNPAANAWQSRMPQPNYTPGQVQPLNRGQPSDQRQPRGNETGHNDGGQWRHDGEAGRNDGGQWRGHDGNDKHGHNGGDGRGHDGGEWRGHDNGERHGNDGQWRGGSGYGHQQRDGEWNHGWRQDNRYDWRNYRESNRDEFHVGRYYAPYRDYYYNRLGVGFYLQPLFFGSDYWISNPWDYRLPPAYGPYRWVRYYNDVILVNTYTGQTVDVIYDFFW